MRDYVRGRRKAAAARQARRPLPAISLSLSSVILLASCLIISSLPASPIEWLIWTRSARAERSQLPVIMCSERFADWTRVASITSSSGPVAMHTCTYCLVAAIVISIRFRPRARERGKGGIRIELASPLDPEAIDWAAMRKFTQSSTHPPGRPHCLHLHCSNHRGKSQTLTVKCVTIIKETPPPRHLRTGSAPKG